MNSPSLREGIRPPVAAIEELLAEHGALRVVAAVLRALARRRSRPGEPGPAPRHLAPGDLAGLPDHVRRDIGLPDLPPRPGWLELR
ncbi:MAG: hypothetical protein JSR87_13455 [Proteobacteria bacterium]|nr:hypothetical protein [Pseudomonadota bacterium]MBS0572897.1 hypothetical protein [Pseudomonadota bacterium]